jgi:hypothetical protein
MREKNDHKNSSPDRTRIAQTLFIAPAIVNSAMQPHIKIEKQSPTDCKENDVLR